MTDQFYTISTLATLSGATGSTYVITNGLKNALGIKARWLGLIVAVIVTLAPIIVGQALLTGEAIFVAACNSFLVYFCAGGASAAFDNSVQPKGGERTNTKAFRESWF